MRSQLVGWTSERKIVLENTDNHPDDVFVNLFSYFQTDDFKKSFYLNILSIALIATDTECVEDLD